MTMPISSPSCFVGSRKWFLIALVLSQANVAVVGQVSDHSGPRNAEGTSALVGNQIGVVKSGNQLIPGATVSATQEATTVVSTTDQNGRYSLQLGQGMWVVEVTMVGFQPAKKRLTVSNADRELDFSLQLKE